MTTLPDLSDLPDLEIYTVVEVLEQETGEHRLLWLHRIAKSGLFACYHTRYAWRAEKMLTILATNFKSLTEDHYFLQVICPPWERAANEGKISRKIPLKEALHLVELNRFAFCAWCEAAGYALPRFWFGGEKIEPSPLAAPVASPSPPHSLASVTLAKLIDRLLDMGTPNTLDDVWNSLASTAGQEGSPIVCLHETEKGPALRYRTGAGIFKDLNRKALGERLRRREG